MIRQVVLALFLVSPLVFPACGGDSEERPLATLAGGTGEVLSPSFDVPGEGWTVRVQFLDIRSDAGDRSDQASWRIAVYSDETGEAVAYVERRVTADASVTEAWATRSAPGSGKPAGARADFVNRARFGTGPGSFHVGVSLTGADRWSAVIIKDPPPPTEL